MENEAERPEAEEEQPGKPDAPPTLEERLEEAERERSQFKEMALRAQADLANYRRRVEEEREEHNRAVAGRFVLKLLPVLDDLQRALDSAPSDAKEEPWVEGIRLIERGIQSVLASEGVSPMDGAEGQTFDPWEQEAVLSVDTEDHQEGTVVSVIRKGYRHHSKVLRPAQVSVAQRKNTEQGSQ
ncbi:MAG: nucleotide exchange factor GrpE [Chloroflexi bacterium]|nr:nucleotide exchange factor GrpE [Chloroflexota bacterium]